MLGPLRIFGRSVCGLPSGSQISAGMKMPFTPYSPGGTGMKLSSKPSQVSVKRPRFSSVTVRTAPDTKVLTIQSGLSGAVIASVTRYVFGSLPSNGN